MQYLFSRIEQETEIKIYRHYVAESLKAISHNTAAWTGGQEMTASLQELTERLYDVAESVEDTQSADEIISHMKNKLAFLGGKEE